MRILSFILALTACTAFAEESVITGASEATPMNTGINYDAYPGRAVPSPATKLDRQLDQVSRELEAALEQRIAERAAAVIAGDKLLVNAD